jgi:hypothetical protein
VVRAKCVNPDDAGGGIPYVGEDDSYVSSDLQVRWISQRTAEFGIAAIELHPPTFL